MPTFQRCDESIEELARELIAKHEDHHPLEKVKIDLVFAYGDCDEKGRLLNDALTKNGIKALGVARKIPLKDRALGRGDAEIALDGDWWKEATDEEQEALLDHELHHIAIKTDKAGNVQWDDLSRPQIKLRKHDVEVGWFHIVAARNGANSIEQQQAKKIMDQFGQYFWPGIAPEPTTVELSSGGVMTGPMSVEKFSQIAKSGFAKKGAKKI